MCKVNQNFQLMTTHQQQQQQQQQQQPDMRIWDLREDSSFKNYELKFPMFSGLLTFYADEEHQMELIYSATQSNKIFVSLI
jgi:hypothetical protein